jgi:hypothetical protein
MTRERLRVLAVCAALALPATALAHKAHEHGVAKLDIAYDAGRLAVELDTPLDNLVGFERAPRTDAERKAADAAVAALRDGGALFRIDPAAQCTLRGVQITSAPLKLGAGGRQAADGHADLEAAYEFECKGAVPAFVEVGLFDGFPRMSRIDVQSATPKGQRKATLKRPGRRVDLAR